MLLPMVAKEAGNSFQWLLLLLVMLIWFVMQLVRSGVDGGSSRGATVTVAGVGVGTRVHMVVLPGIAANTVLAATRS